MRKLYFIFLLFSFLSYSQEQLVSERIKNYNAVKEKEIFDRKRSARISQEFSLKHEKKLGIDTLADNKNEYTFRLSFHNTFITIYRYNNRVFGDIVLVAENREEFNDGEFFKATYSIPPARVEQMLHLIDATAIDTIPDKAYIEGWAQGFDGIGYTLQQKTDSTYTSKDYWSPHLFIMLPEAVAINQFTNKIREIVEYKKILKDFESRIPFDTYSTGSYFTTGKILTTEEYRQKKREVRRRKRELKRNKSNTVIR